MSRKGTRWKNLGFKKMCVVKYLKILGVILSAVLRIGVIPQSIFLFIPRRRMDTFKNKFVKISLEEAGFPFLRLYGPGEADPVLCLEWSCDPFQLMRISYGNFSGTFEKRDIIFLPIFLGI